MIPVLLAVAAFFTGSIPFGYLVAKSKGIDIRTVGSGNIGATNVSRALGKSAALVVFALDVLKGLIPCLAARALITDPIGELPAKLVWFGIGVAALLGHIFCPWLRFKGGKGIATGLGVLLATAPVVGGLAFGVWLVTVLLTSYVSLASICAAIALPFLGWFVPGEPKEMVPAYVLIAAFLIYKHRDNIKRLRGGTESKFRFRK